MPTPDLKVLLIDGGILSGISSHSSNHDEISLSKISSWRFSAPSSPPLPPSSLVPSPPPPSRSNAFATAARDLSISDGCTLVLSPEILISRVFSFPPMDDASIASMVRLKMEKLAPVDDSDLVVAYEVISSSAESTRVLAVAVPTSTLDDLASDLASANLLVSRIDSSLLCEWHSYASTISKNLPSSPLPSLSAVLFTLPSGRIDLFFADAYGPLFARTLGYPTSLDDLSRELTLSFLDFSSESDGASLNSFSIVSQNTPDSSLFSSENLSPIIKNVFSLNPTFISESNLAFPYIVAALKREQKNDCIDIIPPAWREAEKNSISHRRFLFASLSALLLWLLTAAFFFFAPRYIKKQIALVNSNIEKITPAYRTVSDTRQRVRLIRSYEDRSQSLLDVFRTVCTLMPNEMIFASLSYEKSGESTQNGKPIAGGIKISGDCSDSASLLSFKDALDASGIFTPAKLTGPTMDTRRNRFKFEIDSRFQDASLEAKP